MSLEEAQVLNSEDEEDKDSQLNPLENQSCQSENNDNEQGELAKEGENLMNKLIGDKQSDGGNDDEQGELEKEGENLMNKLIGNEKNDSENNNEQDGENDVNDQNDQNNDDQETKPDDESKSIIEENINGSPEEEEEKEKEDDAQNENATAPDDEQHEGNNIDQEIKPDEEQNENNQNDEHTEKDITEKSENSNANGKLGKAQMNMINQLLDDDDEHQTAEEMHTKSNDEDDEKEETDNEKEETDNEKEETDNEKEETDNAKEETDNKKEENDNENNNENDNEKNELSDDFDEGGDNDDPSVMITETSNLIKPPKSPKERTGRRNTLYDTQPVYSDDEIMDQINIMMKEKKLPDQSYHQPIRNYISRGQLEASEQHDYKKAEVLESYLDMLTELLNEVDSSEQEEQRRRSVEEKIQKVNERHQRFLERWNNEKNDKLQEQERNIKAMEDRQSLEISDFQQRCSDQTFIQKYNKPSQSLINLRKAENQMAMAKLFDRAKVLKKKADELQQIEQAEAQMKMNESVMTQYQLIDERHQRERECLEQHIQSVNDTLDKKKEKEQNAYELALAMLQAQLDPQQSRDRVEVVKPPPSKRPIRNNTQLTKVRTPAALEIQTIDFSKFTKQRKIIKPNTTNRKKQK